jgi:hypothetical protein
MTKDKIKIVKNFISDKDIQEYCDYNDWLLENKIDYFFIGGKGKRPVLQFGKDLYEKYQSHTSLDGIIDQHMIDKINSLWRKVSETIGDLFDDKNALYPCSFWIAKQFPGARVAIHEDNDQGANMHFKYSVVLYLNTLSSGGELDFPELGYTIKPDAGDLVVFTSQDTGPHQVLSIPEVRYTIPMWFTEDESFSLFK